MVDQARDDGPHCLGELGFSSSKLRILILEFQSVGRVLDPPLENKHPTIVFYDYLWFSADERISVHIPQLSGNGFLKIKLYLFLTDFSIINKILVQTETG